MGEDCRIARHIMDGGRGRQPQTVGVDADAVRIVPASLDRGPKSQLGLPSAILPPERQPNRIDRLPVHHLRHRQRERLPGCIPDGSPVLLEGVARADQVRSLVEASLRGQLEPQHAAARTRHVLRTELLRPRAQNQLQPAAGDLRHLAETDRHRDLGSGGQQHSRWYLSIADPQHHLGGSTRRAPTHQHNTVEQGRCRDRVARVQDTIDGACGRLQRHATRDDLRLCRVEGQHTAVDGQGRVRDRAQYIRASHTGSRCFRTITCRTQFGQWQTDHHEPAYEVVRDQGLRHRQRGPIAGSRDRQLEGVPCPGRRRQGNGHRQTGGSAGLCLADEGIGQRPAGQRTGRRVLVDPGRCKQGPLDLGVGQSGRLLRGKCVVLETGGALLQQVGHTCLDGIAGLSGGLHDRLQAAFHVACDAVQTRQLGQRTAVGCGLGCLRGRRVRGVERALVVDEGDDIPKDVRQTEHLCDGLSSLRDNLLRGRRRGVGRQRCSAQRLAHGQLCHRRDADVLGLPRRHFDVGTHAVLGVEADGQPRRFVVIVGFVPVQAADLDQVETGCQVGGQGELVGALFLADRDGDQTPVDVIDFDDDRDNERPSEGGDQ